jgi:hypothetical protein
MTRLVRVAHYFADESMQGTMQRIKQTAIDEGWKVFFQGIPVSQEFNDYLEGIAKVMPKLKFAPYEIAYANKTVFDESGTYQTTKSFRLAKSILLYMDEYPFELGRASYGDHSVNTSGEETYAVYSRRISNAKYAQHRDQHHMIMASDMSKAIKNIRKYVVPYTARELARALYDPFFTGVGRALQKAQSDVGEAIKTVKYNDRALITEIQHLMKMGVQFSTPEFAELAKTLPSLTEQLVTEKNRKPDGMFVAFKQIGEETYADICVASDVRSSYQPKFTEDIQTVKVSDLPQEIAGNIAVLNILQNDAYVDGVGAKIDDTHFWLERG